MDNSLGNLNLYKILPGIVSVMKIFEIYCYCKYYCSRLPRLTMLRMLLTWHLDKLCCLARYLRIGYLKVVIVSIPEQWCWFGIQGIHMGWQRLGVNLLMMWSVILRLKKWLEWIGSLESEPIFIGSSIAMVKIYSWHVSPITLTKQIYAFSLPRLTNKYMVVPLYCKGIK